MDWLSQNLIWVLVFAAFIEAVVAGTINAQQTENNRARIGRKVIITEKG